MKKNKDEKLQVYFNSACSICNAGINLQRSKTTGCDVSWNDIHTHNLCAQEANPNINVVRKYLHVVNSRDEKYVGIDAFVQLWKYSPLEQRKAKLFALPIINPVAKACYFVLANFLFAWNRLMKNWDQ